MKLATCVLFAFTLSGCCQSLWAWGQTEVPLRTARSPASYHMEKNPAHFGPSVEWFNQMSAAGWDYVGIVQDRREWGGSGPNTQWDFYIFRKEQP